MSRASIVFLSFLVLGRAVEPRSAEASSAPTTIDWVTGDYLPVVGDQGCSETCVAWAVRTVAAFHRFRIASGFASYSCPAAGQAAPTPITTAFALGAKDPQVPPSPTFLFNAALRKSFQDTNPSANASFEQWVMPATTSDPKARMSFFPDQLVCALRDYGAPSEDVAEFNRDWTAIPSAGQSTSATNLWSEWRGAIGGARPIPHGTHPKPNANDLRAELCNGPVIALVHTFDDFLPCGLVQDDYAPRPNSSRKIGAKHAMVVVAFDKFHAVPGDGPKPSFRLMNSWGTGWGNGGFTWISADRLFSCNYGGTAMVDSLWTCVPLTSSDACPTMGFTTSSTNAPRPLPKGFANTSQSIGWSADGSTACSGPCLSALPTPTDPPPPSPQPRPPSPDPDTDPDSDGGPVACSAAAPQAHVVGVERVVGAHATVTAPSFPLVPALSRTRVRYLIDGREGEDVDPLVTGYAFHFAGHDTRRPVMDIPQAAPAAAPATRGGAANAIPEPLVKTRDASSTVDRDDLETTPCPVPFVDSGVGQDPAVIGACFDRGIFEIVDPNHPCLKDGRDIPICIEIYYPCECEPRAVARYVIRVAK